jgi:acetyl esterase
MVGAPRFRDQDITQLDTSPNRDARRRVGSLTRVNPESDIAANLPGGPPPPSRWLLPPKVLRAATRLTPKALTVLPTPVKRLLSGRSVVVEGNTLDPTIQMFLTGQRLAGLTGLVVTDEVAATRRVTHDSLVSFGGAPIPVGVTELSIPGPAGAIGVRHYDPSGSGPTAGPPAPVLVYYHGGGYVFGGLDGYDSICRLICRDAGVHVLSVDYRLAPEHKAPAAVEDAYAAYRWATEHAAELGAAPDVAVGGDSAGGGLATVVSRLARDGGGPLPVFQLLVYPVTDIAAQTRSRTLFASGFLLTQHDMEFFARQYVDGSGIAPDDPRISPLHADDLAGLPPALLITGGFDPLRDEGNRYATALRDAGVPVDHRQFGSMIHGFFNFNAFGGGVSAAVGEINSALRAHLHRS